MTALPDDRRAATVRRGSAAGACDTGEPLRKVEAPCPHLPVFNGKVPPRHSFAEPFDIAESRCRLEAQTFALPSTPGAARCWLSIQPWRRLAELRRDGPVR